MDIDTTHNDCLDTAAKQPTSLKRFQNDWQSDELTITQSIAFLYNNELGSDVTFIVNKNKIPAHSLILTVRSPVFCTMFKDSCWKESVEKQVTTEDWLNVEYFLQFLRFLYTDKCLMTWKNIFTLVYLAEKYQVSFLKSECEKFLRGRLAEETVLLALQESMHEENRGTTTSIIDHEKLQERCMGYIGLYTEKCINTAMFLMLDKEALKMILHDDNLTITELSLYLKTIEWCKVYLESEKVSFNGENIRQHLSDVICLLRFPCMNAEEFAKNVACDRDLEGMLLSKEIADVYTFVTLKNSSFVPTLKFNTEPREFGRFKIHRLSLLPNDSPNETYYGNDLFASLTLEKATRGIFLLGVSISSSDLQEVQNVRVEARRRNSYSNRHIACQVFEGGEIPGQGANALSIFHLIFDEIVSIPQNEPYEITLRLRSYYETTPSAGETCEAKDEDGLITFTYKSVGHNMREFLYWPMD